MADNIHAVHVGASDYGEMAELIDDLVVESFHVHEVI